MKNDKNKRKEKKPFFDPGPIPITDRHIRDFFPTAVNTKPQQKRVLKIPG
jgi:hypothetical protein